MMSKDLDMQERLPVWTALSELFLDTSFDEEDHHRIAEALKRSPYRRGQIERILRDEVSPAFTGNLCNIAGEWQRWSDEEVQQIMQRSLSRRSARNIFTRMRWYLAPRIIPDDWQHIARRLE